MIREQKTTQPPSKHRPTILWFVLQYSGAENTVITGGSVRVCACSVVSSSSPPFASTLERLPFR